MTSSDLAKDPARRRAGYQLHFDPSSKDYIRVYLNSSFVHISKKRVQLRVYEKKRILVFTTTKSIVAAIQYFIKGGYNLRTKRLSLWENWQIVSVKWTSITRAAEGTLYSSALIPLPIANTLRH